MSYLDQLEALDSGNTPPPSTAKTALSPSDSNGSAQGRQFSESRPTQDVEEVNGNTPTPSTAKTALSPYGSKDSAQGRQFSEIDPAHEAAEERAAIVEYEAGLSRADANEVAALAEQFYSHLFGPAKTTGCCHAPAGRYCPEGLQLKDSYYTACTQRRASHDRQ